MSVHFPYNKLGAGSVIGANLLNLTLNLNVPEFQLKLRALRSIMRQIFYASDLLYILDNFGDSL